MLMIYGGALFVRCYSDFFFFCQRTFSCHQKYSEHPYVHHIKENIIEHGIEPLFYSVFFISNKYDNLFVPKIAS